jgi:hypothetical protein
MDKILSPKKDNNKFQYEYLYIDDAPLQPLKKQQETKEKTIKEEDKRGIEIIQLF